jgi:hypothetical protein
MGTPIYYKILPAGSTIFRGGDNVPYVTDFLTEDLLLSSNQSHHYGIPYEIRHLIRDNTNGRILRFEKVQVDDNLYYFFMQVDAQQQELKWPDGSVVEEDQYFSIAGGVDILQAEGNSNILYNYNQKIKAEKAPRKYNGKIVNAKTLTKPALPADAKPGVYLVYKDGECAVHIDNVIRAEAPKPRKEAKESGPTFRQVFVPGTTWKVTKEIKLPKIIKTPSHSYNGHQYYTTTLEEDAGAVIPVGAEFKLTEKVSQPGPGYSSGLWFTNTFGGTVTHWARVSDVNGKVERILSAQSNVNVDGTVNLDSNDIIPVFYIYDTSEQKYFKGDAGNWKNGYQHAIEYSEKGIRGCKNWKRLSDVRQFALNASGYYVGLPDMYGGAEYYTTGYKFDIPDTWEIHEYDKSTKQLVKKIDLVESFKRTWRLRDLTIKFGSAVRQVYSDLEKKKKLDEFSAMVVFSKKEDDKYYYDYELTDTEKAKINEAVEVLDKKDYKRAKSDTQMAFAIKDITTAIQIRLTYSGSLEIVMIDLKKMTEVIEEKEQA